MVGGFTQSFYRGTLHIKNFSVGMAGLRRRPITIRAHVSAPRVIPPLRSSIHIRRVYWSPQVFLEVNETCTIVSLETVVEYDIAVSASAIWYIIEGRCFLTRDN